MSKLIRRNPPWTNKILAAHWDALLQRVGAAWMPLPLEGGRRKGYQEFGCGHYGCVMPTGTKDLVMKITTDQSEAAFVAAYLSLPAHRRPTGVVPYHRIIAITSESHRKRPVFALWRDEAYFVGNVRGWIRQEARDFEVDYYGRSYTAVEREIGNTLRAGRDIRSLVIKQKDPFALFARAMELRDEVWARGVPPSHLRDRASKLAWFLNSFRYSADALRSEPMGDYIGEALSTCLDEGLVLADVHLNNIGMPSGELVEEIGMIPVVTDPGHAIAIDTRYDGLQIEEL